MRWGQNPISLTGFDDVKALITDRAAYFAIGRIVRLQEGASEGPGCVPKPPLNCEHEIRFQILGQLLERPVRCLRNAG